jgi:hypothetical protein
MFSFPMGAIPIDKESLRFMCAWTLIRENEEEARSAVEERRRVELDALNRTYKEGESSAKTKERCEKKEVIEKEYNQQLRQIGRFRRQKEIKLMRRVAGPLAKLVEA